MPSSPVGLACLAVLGLGAAHSPAAPVAQRPPLGWNSYDCFGAAVHEDEVRANARIMAAHLKRCGWAYIVVDYCWSYPFIGAMNNPPQTGDFQPRIRMDRYGRQLPALDRFPSAAGDAGFRPLADYVHGLGLKFGIHIMRGILRQAVADNTPILGHRARAGDIADRDSTCSWLNHMVGVNVDRSGAQAYYDSLFAQYAAWGVDYVKVDDISRPYHAGEIEAVRRALDRCGRPMVLSLSPGQTPLAQAEHVKRQANLWRISSDFWDDWDKLERNFGLCAQWARHSGPGHWPDADMLPLGRLRRRGPFGPESDSRFTRDEQRTLLTLWCMARSPLMIGGDLQLLTRDLLALLTNTEVLAVDQNSTGNHQVLREESAVVWAADTPDGTGRYVALFNLGDTTAPVRTELDVLGLSGPCRVRDLWAHRDLDPVTQRIEATVRPHAAHLYRLDP